MKFTKTLETISRKTGDRPGEVWSRYLAMSFCALSYGAQEELYLETIKPYKDRKDVLDLYVQAFAHMVEDYDEGRRYADHLGEYHMSLQSTKAAQFNGEYFTPTAVSEMVASLSIDEIPKDEPLSVHEPTCGSGRMVLAVASVLEKRGYCGRCMKAIAWDLSPHCYYMAYINLTLWGIPAIVTHGNTLSLERFSEQQNPFWIMAHPPRIPNI